MNWIEKVLIFASGSFYWFLALIQDWKDNGGVAAVGVTFDGLFPYLKVIESKTAHTQTKTNGGAARKKKNPKESPYIISGRARKRKLIEWQGNDKSCETPSLQSSSNVYAMTSPITNHRLITKSLRWTGNWQLFSADQFESANELLGFIEIEIQVSIHPIWQSIWLGRFDWIDSDLMLYPVIMQIVIELFMYSRY